MPSNIAQGLGTIMSLNSIAGRALAQGAFLTLAGQYNGIAQPKAWWDRGARQMSCFRECRHEHGVGHHLLAQHKLCC